MRSNFLLFASSSSSSSSFGSRKTHSRAVRTFAAISDNQILASNGRSALSWPAIPSESLLIRFTSRIAKTIKHWLLIVARRVRGWWEGLDSEVKFEAVEPIRTRVHAGTQALSLSVPYDQGGERASSGSEGGDFLDFESRLGQGPSEIKASEAIQKLRNSRMSLVDRCRSVCWHQVTLSISRTANRVKIDFSMKY